jgi:diguanylate cyclase (GGDEF)-like protein
MLPNTTTLGAAIIAERIRAHTEELEVEYDNQSIQITISIGISQILDTDTNSNAALSRADAALYQAKKKGRNRIEIN